MGFMGLFAMLACANRATTPDPWAAQKEECVIYQSKITGQCFMVIKGQEPTQVSCERKCQ